MKTLKYTIIKNEKQYDQYCNILEKMLDKENGDMADEIELLTLLIEKWDSENTTFNDLEPVAIIKSLMVENNLKAKDLVEILGLSKATVSKVLNYQKGLSKETIRKLSSYFKISQEAFNRPYKLVNEINKQFHHGSLKKTKKYIGKTITV